MKLHKNQKLFLWFSVGLLVLSLTQEAYCTGNCTSSWIIFFFGFMGLFAGGAALTWLANPLLIFSWFALKSNPKLSFISSIGATLLASSFLLFDKIIDNEAGHYNEIVSYGTGYWLWLFSCATITIGSYINNKITAPIKEI